MSERWLKCTRMEKQTEGGAYVEIGETYINMPCILEIQEYQTSAGDTYTCLTNDYHHALYKEPIDHFLIP